MTLDDGVMEGVRGRRQKIVRSDVVRDMYSRSGLKKDELVNERQRRIKRAPSASRIEQTSGTTVEAEMDDRMVDGEIEARDQDGGTYRREQK